MGRNPCPTEDELSAFNVGDLPGPALDAIAAHLDSCPGCEARVASLDAKVDPVIQTLRRSATLLSWSGAGTGPEGTAPAEGGRPRLAGYEIGEVLGEGGMGIVYKARHRVLNRVVALKLIAGNPGRHTARFRLEAESAARLHHPNIVQIFEIGDQDGRPYLALEYVGGGSLESELAGRPQPPRRSAELVRTLALAADEAHRHGIVHRDLKPSNILMTPEGMPKIADFGVAKRLEVDDGCSLDGDIVGTPAYMAPEQASGQSDRLGPATDVYSLGVILYEMLTGRVPHRAATVIETLAMVREHEPVPPRRLQPKLPRDLETIALACLRKEPARRYSGARALADDLGRYLAGEPIRARPVGPGERAYKWARRHAALSGLIVAAILGLATAGVATWRVNATLRWYNGRLQDRARAEAAQRQRAEAVLYASRIGLAEGEWRSDNVAASVRLLDECRPGPGQADPRGWEWSYLDRLCHADLLTLGGHPGWVHDLDFCSGGTRIVAASGTLSRAGDAIGDAGGLATPGSLKVWDAETGRPMADLAGHSGAVLSVASSPDGRRIASAGADGAVFLWDASTYRRVALREGPPRGAASVRFSPDGRILAVGDDQSLTLWHVDVPRSARVLRRGRAFRSLAFSPDGRWIASADGSGTVEVIDLATGQPVRAFRGSSDRILCVAFSPDGLQMATSETDGLVVVREADGDEILHRFRGHSGEATCVAFGPDGRQLASGGADQTVRLWDLVRSTERLVFRGHTFGVRNLAFSPDGERIASAGQDGAVKVWDVTRDPRGLDYQAEIAGGEWVGGIAFSADGTRLFRADHDRGHLQTWTVSSGLLEPSRPIGISRGPDAPGVASAFSPDGRLLAASARHRPGVVKVWDVATGREVASLAGRAARATAVAISPDGRRVASASGDGAGRPEAITAWDLATGRALASWNVEGPTVRRLAIGPDGATLASAHEDGSVRLWWADSGRELLRLAGHRGAANAVAFAPDGRRFASVGQDDATVRVWDTTTSRELLILRGHNLPITGVAFSPDGRRIASVGVESIVKVWDAVTGREILSLRGLGPRRPGATSFTANVVFSRDGTRIAANGWDGRVTAWDAPTTPEGPAARQASARSRAYAWHIREADPSGFFPGRRAFGDQFHLTRVANAAPPDEALRLARARLFIRLGRWDRADTDIEHALTIGTADDPWLWFEHTCLRLLEGDPDGYRRACARLVEKFGTTADPDTADALARACTLGPASGVGPDRIVRWVDLARADDPEPARPLILLGASQYRAGRPDLALDWLGQASRVDPGWEGHVINRLLLALTHHRLGHREESLRWLEQTFPTPTTGDPSSPVAKANVQLKDLHDLLVYLVLKREVTPILAAGAGPIDPPPP